MNQMKEVLIELSHSKFLAAQRLHRFVLSDNFGRAIEEATPDQIKELREYIEDGNLDRLRALTRVIIRNDLSAKSMTELRLLGRMYRIKDYTNLTKASLLSALSSRT
jgi:hypothetical protein